MKIFVLDTYYPAVLESVGKLGLDYKTHLQGLLNLHFGTSYYYSEAFWKMGWEAADIIGNDTHGRQLWAREARIPWASNLDSVVDQIVRERPNVVYCQDLGFIPRGVMDQLRTRHGIHFVAQHSCPWAGDEQVGGFDLVFTSFPHYIHRIRTLGVSAAFLPIAFSHQLLTKVPARTREYDVVFVGGVNAGSGHWSRGTELLETLAEELGPTFQWWGYIIGDEARLGPHLARAYRGPAWGLEMYRIYSAAKVVFNRHGEVAQGYANNMRLFEATGMGACLLTEEASNLHLYFKSDTECLTYDDPEHAVRQVTNILDNPTLLASIAAAGQRRTLAEHTYEKRLAGVESKLKEICG